MSIIHFNIKHVCVTVCVCVCVGWRPRRTIIFASWDAEEFGLLGSTEWAEVLNTTAITMHTYTCAQNK